MKNLIRVSKVYRDGLEEAEKLKLSTLEAPVFYSYYDLWSEESNKLFKRSVILKRRYNKIRKIRGADRMISSAPWKLVFSSEF